MAQSSNPVGTYTSAAKHAIQNMIGLSGILGNYESTGMASKAYVIGDTFIFEGVRYRATAAIALNDVIAPGTNCELDPLDGRYIRNTDKAGSTGSRLGLVFANAEYGIGISEYGGLYLTRAAENVIKAGTNEYKTIAPYNQHQSVFYGFAKAAGDTTQAQSANAVGTYTEQAKAAIQSMLGVPSTADLPVFATKAETEEIITEWSGPIIPSAQGVSF